MTATDNNGNSLAQQRPADPVACIVDGVHGIYVPQEFALRWQPEAWGLSREEFANEDGSDWDCILGGPDEEYYWEAWESILGRARFQHPSRPNGEPAAWAGASLYQDGDLFMVHRDAVWSESEEWFVWPEDQGGES